MWLFVHFDLPTTTKQDKRAYTVFRQKLLKDGFSMMQYSTYVRHCASKENLQVHKKRVKRAIPKYGKVMLFEITDKQFGRIDFFEGKKAVDAPSTPQQLELF